MGAYLSEPITEKESSDEANEVLQCGASSMQGWRMSQEDAHNCILDFDRNTSFFAVYDGHGGAEVALYCAAQLPKFLRIHAQYAAGNYEAALREAFVEFDGTLLESHIIDELTKLVPAENRDGDSGSDADSAENLDELCQEGRMPIEQLLEKYKEARKAQQANGAAAAEDVANGSGSASASGVGYASVADSNAGSSSSGSGSGKRRRTATSAKAGTADDQATDAQSSSSSSTAAAAPATANGSGGSAPSTEGSKPSEENGKASAAAAATEAKVTAKPSGNAAAAAADTDESTTDDDDEYKNAAKAKAKAEQKVAVDDDDDDDEDDNDGEDDEEEDDDDDDDDDDDEEDDDDEDDDDDDDEEDVGDMVDDDEDEDVTNFMNTMSEGPGSSSGCTAVVALLVERSLFVANAGDSRCVVCRDGHAVEMSFDHKPEDEPEKARIEKAGGRVTLDGRVNGGLNLSRAIGDHGYKLNKSLKPEEQMISPLPDIKHLTIDPRDEFMIIACDGIWNYMSSEAVVEFVRARINDGRQTVSSICEELFTNCLAENTMGDGTGCDNMTAVIVRFKPALYDRPALPENGAAADSLPSTKKRCASSPSASPDEDKAKRIKTAADEAATVVDGAVVQPEATESETAAAVAAVTDSTATAQDEPMAAASQ